MRVPSTRKVTQFFRYFFSRLLPKKEMQVNHYHPLYHKIGSKLHCEFTFSPTPLQVRVSYYRKSTQLITRQPPKWGSTARAASTIPTCIAEKNTLTELFMSNYATRRGNLRALLRDSLPGNIRLLLRSPTVATYELHLRSSFTAITYEVPPAHHLRGAATNLRR